MGTTALRNAAYRLLRRVIEPRFHSVSVQTVWDIIFLGGGRVFNRKRNREEIACLSGKSCYLVRRLSWNGVWEGEEKPKRTTPGSSRTCLSFRRTISTLLIEKHKLNWAISPSEQYFGLLSDSGKLAEIGGQLLAGFRFQFCRNGADSGRMCVSRACLSCLL